MTWIPSETRRAVARRHGAVRGSRIEVSCFYCGATGEISWPEQPGGWVNFPGLQLDHFVPVARGGQGNPENIVLACPSCNASKRDRLFPNEWAPGRAA